MQTVGVIGGIAPASTIDYYRLLIERYRERRPDAGYPSIFINSIDLRRLLELVESGDRAGLTAYLLMEIVRLARAGADFGLFASNTPHLVFDELQRQSPIPLISMVEAAGAAAVTQGLRKVGLLGTRFTMEGGFYSTVFARRGVTVVLPGAEDRSYVHERYIGELVAGVYRAETRDEMLAIVDRMKERDGIEGVVLGGTELPLLLRESRRTEIPMLDTSRIHVESAIDRLLSTAV